MNAPFPSVVPASAPDAYATPEIGAPVAKRRTPLLVVGAPFIGWPEVPLDVAPDVPGRGAAGSPVAGAVGAVVSAVAAGPDASAQAPTRRTAPSDRPSERRERRGSGRGTGSVE